MKVGYDGVAGLQQRELRQIQDCRFTQVCDGLFDRFTLCSRSRLRVERDKAAFFGGRQDGGKLHDGVPLQQLGRLSRDFQKTPPTNS